MENILVIEDNEEYTAAFKTFLGAKGLDVTNAYDFESGKAALQKQQYDGIVTDLFFPRNAGVNDSVEPLGFHFLKYGIEKNLPSVLATDGYHHDANMEGFHQSGLFGEGKYFVEHPDYLNKDKLRRSLRTKAKVDEQGRDEIAYLKFLVKYLDERDRISTRKASFSTQTLVYDRLIAQTKADFDGGRVKEKFLDAARNLEEIL